MRVESKAVLFSLCTCLAVAISPMCAGGGKQYMPELAEIPGLNKTSCGLFTTWMEPCPSGNA